MPAKEKEKYFRGTWNEKGLFTWNVHRSPVLSLCTPQMGEYNGMLRH